LPVLGSVPVDEVGIEHVLRVLTPIWYTKSEAAVRLRQRIERILDSARVLPGTAREGVARARFSQQMMNGVSCPEGAARIVRRFGDGMRFERRPFAAARAGCGRYQNSIFGSQVASGENSQTRSMPRVWRAMKGRTPR
jgi:hypothetical protein